MFAGSLATFLIWGAFELRTTAPLVDLRMTASRPVLFTNLASVAMGFALFSSSIVFPRLLELPSDTGFGLSLLTASLVISPSGLAMIATSPIAGRLERRLRARTLLASGAVVLALSYGLAVPFHDHVWQIAAANALIGIGVGLGYAALPILIMGAVPTEETGGANGLNTLMRSLGTSVTSAFVGATLAETIRPETAASHPGEFAVALSFGLIAALICLCFAALIPGNRESEAAANDGGPRCPTLTGQREPHGHKIAAIPVFSCGSQPGISTRTSRPRVVV